MVDSNGKMYANQGEFTGKMKNYGWEGMRFMLDMDIYLDQLI